MCKDGKHNLVVIYYQKYWDDCFEVVRWCNQCGAIVIDKEIDNRIFPGKTMKMIFPKIAYESNITS